MLPPSSFLSRTHSLFDLSPVDIFYFLFPSSPGSDLEVRRGSAGCSRAKELSLTHSADSACLLLKLASNCHVFIFHPMLPVIFNIQNKIGIVRLNLHTSSYSCADVFMGWVRVIGFCMSLDGVILRSSQENVRINTFIELCAFPLNA